MKQTHIKEILGCLPKALFWNFLIGAAALLADVFFGGPKIYIGQTSAVTVFYALLILCIIIICWSVWTLIRNPRRETLTTDGPYRFSRHPIYAAIIFLLNPALGIMFRSWLLLLAAIPIYFVWRKLARAQEQSLTEKYGAQYQDYANKVWRFFPNLRPISPVLFYAGIGLAIFSICFVSLNFGAFFLRWVVFETHGRIVYDDPSPVQSTFTPVSQDAIQNPNQYLSLPSNQPNNSPNYSGKPDSIIIGRIKIDAPLLWAADTSQRSLNEALNQGVILYPGSALPGAKGEVIVSGHSSVFPWVKTQYGQVFTLLDKLRPGDTVSLIYERRQYDYRVTGQQILDPDKVRIIDTKLPLLKMVTCWPVGTSARRLVVYGELIE